MTTTIINKESMEAIERFINSNKQANVYAAVDAIQYIVLRKQNTFIDYDECVEILINMIYEHNNHKAVC